MLGLGSNLGDRLDTLQRAVDMLGDDPSVRIVVCSRVWETDPVGGVEQPDFLKRTQPYPAPSEDLDKKMQDVWTEMIQAQ